MTNTIGIDVGGTKVLGGVVSESGEILATTRRDTPREGGGALTQTIADVALELSKEYPVDSIGVLRKIDSGFFARRRPCSRFQDFDLLFRPYRFACRHYGYARLRSYCLGNQRFA